MQDEAQETEHARCCGEHDCPVPSATHAEVMKLGNLTQESPSSVGADEAPNGLGQLVTQPVPGAQAWLEGFLGQGSVRGRPERWNAFSVFWEALEGQINSGVRISCEFSVPAGAREVLSTWSLPCVNGTAPWMCMPMTNEIGYPIVQMRESEKPVLLSFSIMALSLLKLQYESVIACYKNRQTPESEQAFKYGL